MTKTFSILLIDDEADFLDPIAFWLESKGYDVRTASNGEEGLARIKEQVPNIVLLDVNMPVMNGIDTLKHIREEHEQLPVIMITAEFERLQAIQDMGISGFFPKEGTLEQLEKLLEPIIRIHANQSKSKS